MSNKRRIEFNTSDILNRDIVDAEIVEQDTEGKLSAKEEALRAIEQLKNKSIELDDFDEQLESVYEELRQQHNLECSVDEFKVFLRDYYKLTNEERQYIDLINSMLIERLDKFMTSKIVFTTETVLTNLLNELKQRSEFIGPSEEGNNNLMYVGSVIKIVKDADSLLHQLKNNRTIKEIDRRFSQINKPLKTSADKMETASLLAAIRRKLSDNVVKTSVDSTKKSNLKEDSDK